MDTVGKGRLGYASKAQSSMESLLTYGIVLLILIIVISVAFYFLSLPKSFAPALCTLPSTDGGVSCTALVINTNSILKSTTAYIYVQDYSTYPINEISVFTQIGGINASPLQCLPANLISGESAVCTAQLPSYMPVGQYLSGAVYMQFSSCGLSATYLQSGVCTGSQMQIIKGTFTATVGSGQPQTTTTSTSTTSTSTAATTITSTTSTSTIPLSGEYYLTVKASPADGGTVSPQSGYYSAGVQVQLSESPSSSYSFNGWVGNGQGSYTGSLDAPTIVMNGPIVETANFIPYTPGGCSSSQEICFDTYPSNRLSGVPLSTYVIKLSSSGNQVTVMESNIPYNYMETAVTYSWYSPLSVSPFQEQWVWNGMNQASDCQGQPLTQSGTLNPFLSGPCLQMADYANQYYLATTVSGSGTGTVEPSSMWQDSGNTVQIIAMPTGGSTFGGWSCTGTGCYSGSNEVANIVMNNAITEKAIFN